MSEWMRRAADKEPEPEWLSRIPSTYAPQRLWAAALLVLLFVVGLSRLGPAHGTLGVVQAGSLMTLAVAGMWNVLQSAGTMPAPRPRVTATPGEVTVSGPRVEMSMPAGAVSLVAMTVAIYSFCPDAVTHPKDYGPVGLAIYVMAALSLWMVFQLFYTDFNDRRLTVTADEIRIERGRGVTTIPWSTVKDIPLNSGEAIRKNPKNPVPYLRLAVTTTPVVTGPVWKPYANPTFDYPLRGYSVDPSTILNALIVLHEYPEHRALIEAGRGDVLFQGPPASQLGDMRVGQPYWPWGQRLRETLAEIEREPGAAVAQ